MRLLGIGLAILSLAAVAQAQVNMGALKRGHPRIAFTEQDEQRIKNLMRSDDLLEKLVQRNNQLADRGIGLPTTKRQLIGPRMLDESRIAIERVVQQAMAYRMTGNRKYADRGIQEMMMAARFSDWNPSHFLDVGEMLTAMGIGYDWLYDAMSRSERDTIRSAIVDKGIKVAISQQGSREQMWMTGDNNWTSVVNGGLIVAALAIADEEPSLAKAVIDRGIKAIKKMDKVYRPDGATHEGPLYWHYGFTFHALAHRALATALPGHSLYGDSVYSKTGAFPIYLQGPTGAWYNYADSTSQFYLSPAMFELSRNFNNSFYAWWTRDQLQSLLGPQFRTYNNEYRMFPMFIAWYDSRGSASDAPLDAKFLGKSQVFTMRGSWTRNDASFVGGKGGNNSLSHAHQDVGSFVYEALGVRWAVDLGPDNYNLPGYWENKEGGDRWKLFRLHALSHNTITIGGRNQRISGLSSITRTGFSGNNPIAIVDLGSAYRGHASSIKRGFKLIGREDLLIQDEISGAIGDIRWTMMTAANISLNGDRATLSQAGKTLTARILSPSNATFKVLGADPEMSGQNRNSGYRRLAIELGSARSGRIVVQLSPGGNPRPASVQPLAEWR
ncbi:MAG: heparinase II/III family protein [Fimbriimonadales bacterium]